MTNDQEKYVNLKHLFLMFEHKAMLILQFFFNYSFNFRNVEIVTQKLASIISTGTLY